MANTGLTLFFAWVLLGLKEDTRGFEKYCQRARQNNIRKGWSEERKAQHVEENAAWARNNPDRRKEISRTSAQSNRDAFPGKAAEEMRNWRAKNPERNRQNQRTWEASADKTNLNWKIGKRLRNRIKDALNRKASRAGTLLDLLGCSVLACQKHLEALFKLGMSWENYGKWHIDHKRPCASFDLTDLEQQKICFHFSNLQPLWREENLSKSAKWEGQP
jgi:hypothetical protein